ncbi:MAG TPA: GNAT family N-acetyltransferase [Burkholderiales bacterium]|nr:GNAT family N-acetyltransferase [Burkholderiales bacterium]
MTITIAPLVEDDVEALSGLAASIWRAHYPAIIGIAQTEYMLAQRYDPAVLREELARTEIWWDVLRDNGEMIAFASSFPSGAPGELKLDKLYVHPAHQRQGYGGVLLAHTCERARESGFRTLVLAVNKHNVKAIAAYRKHGFDVRDAIVKEIGGGFVMDDYIMVKAVRCE